MDDDGTEVNETENKQNPNKVLNIACGVSVCIRRSWRRRFVVCVRVGGRTQDDVTLQYVCII